MLSVVGQLTLALGRSTLCLLASKAEREAS